MSEHTLAGGGVPGTETKPRKRGRPMKRRPRTRQDEQSETPPVSGQPSAEQPTPEKPKRGRPPGKRVKLWDRQAEMLKSKVTTSRNTFAETPMWVDIPDEVAKHIEVHWDSTDRETRRPVLPGYPGEIWQPVTEEVAKELGITPLTTDKTPDGTYKVGFDAILKWAPRKTLALHRARVKKPSAIEILKGRKREFQETIRKDEAGASAPIGDITMPGSPEDLVRAEALQREEVGSLDG